MSKESTKTVSQFTLNTYPVSASPTPKDAFVVFTSRNELWFGFSDNNISDKEMLLLEPQMCVKYEDTRGFAGIAIHGPNSKCRVSFVGSELYVRDICFALKVTDPAVIKEWKKCPWAP